MNWPWVSRKKAVRKIEELEREIVQLSSENKEVVGSVRDLMRNNNLLSSANRRLSVEVNDTNKYARALEKTWNGNSSPVFMDYGKANERDLHERMTVTKIVRPDIMSRDLMFQVVIPEDWERIFNGLDDLTRFIEHRMRGLLE